ncbi:MAG: hypothetical protein RLZZ453_997 [Chlamydiota bacterium]|jgi:hypothetical protein
MQKNWKNVLPFALTALVAFTSVASADSSNSAQMRNLENRVSALEQRKGAGGMINPQGRPQVCHGVDVFVFGSLLYWNAHENGLSVAVKAPSTNSLVHDNLLENSVVKNMSGKWNWGFRVGLGYNTMHDGWDLRMPWTRFTDTGHRNPNTAGAQFFPTQAMPSFVEDVSTGGSTTSVGAYWGLNINVLDLDLGREFFVSKWLTLRPHGGLRTNWIHQNMHIFYGHLAATDFPATPNANVTMSDHWWGLGLEGGLDTQWGLGGGWSVFGNMSAAVLYGLHEMENENNLIDGATFATLSDSYHITHPMLDFIVGLRWDHLFCNDRFHIGFDLGWEHHLFLSQNQFPVFVDEANAGAFVANQGDLTLQGWTFSARFDF